VGMGVPIYSSPSLGRLKVRSYDAFRRKVRVLRRTREAQFGPEYAVGGSAWSGSSPRRSLKTDCRAVCGAGLMTP